MNLDNDKIKYMDNFILLSLVNTKLRDECDSFKNFLGVYNLKASTILEKLQSIGYKYDESLNQFTDN